VDTKHELRRVRQEELVRQMRTIQEEMVQLNNAVSRSPMSGQTSDSDLSDMREQIRVLQERISVLQSQKEQDAPPTYIA